VMPEGCDVAGGAQRTHLRDVVRTQGMESSGNGKKIWVELTEDFFAAHVERV
jgi:hypothetical protein